MIRIILILLPFVGYGQFYKYSTIYGGMSLQSEIAPIETYQYINNELIETTPDLGDNYRYFIGIKKIQIEEDYDF